MEDWQRGYQSYWFDGMDTNSGKLAYRTFSELPIKRKLRYLGYFGMVKGLQVVRSPLQKIAGFDLGEYPFRGLPKSPEPLTPQNFGPTREDREALGLDPKDFLSQAEVQEFAHKGVIGPFRAISEDKATQIYRLLQDTRLENEFTSHFQHPEIGDALKSRPITARVASLLGENLKMWRSQVFRVPAGKTGTYFHAENDFKETDTVPAFSQNIRPLNLGQLTVWMALHPVERHSAALKMITGTHKYPVASEIRNRLNTLPKAAPWLAANPELIDEVTMAVLGQDHPSGLISAFPMARATMKALLDRYGAQLEQVGQLETKVMRPGEFVIFTSSVMHGSWSNSSDQDRIAVGARVTTRDAEFRESPGLMEIPLQWSLPPMSEQTLLRCPEPKLTQSDSSITVEFGSCEIEFDNEWKPFAEGLKQKRIFTPQEALQWGHIPDKDTLFEYLDALVDEGVITFVYSSNPR